MKTAVEWLINEMHKKEQGLIETSYNHIFDQAKEMEAEQRAKIRLEGYGEGYDEGLYDALNK